MTTHVKIDIDDLATSEQRLTRFGDSAEEFKEQTQEYLEVLKQLAAKYGIRTMAGFMLLENGQVCNIFLNGVQKVNPTEVVEMMADVIKEVVFGIAEDTRRHAAQEAADRQDDLTKDRS